MEQLYYIHAGTKTFYFQLLIQTPTLSAISNLFIHSLIQSFIHSFILIWLAVFKIHFRLWLFDSWYLSIYPVSESISRSIVYLWLSAKALRKKTQLIFRVNLPNWKFKQISNLKTEIHLFIVLNKFTKLDFYLHIQIRCQNNPSDEIEARRTTPLVSGDGWLASTASYGFCS